MFSFVKELDDPTRDLVRWLEENRERLFTEYRVKPVVFWVGGDKETLSAWAQRHGLEDFPLAVVPLDQEELAAWNVERRRTVTVLLQRPGMVVENLTDVVPGEDEFEQALQRHFP